MTKVEKFLDKLPILLGGAKELGIVYINIIRGAKEPRNLQNQRGVREFHLQSFFLDTPGLVKKHDEWILPKYPTLYRHSLPQIPSKYPVCRALGCVGYSSLSTRYFGLQGSDFGYLRGQG